MSALRLSSARHRLRHAISYVPPGQRTQFSALPRSRQRFLRNEIGSLIILSVRRLPWIYYDRAADATLCGTPPPEARTRQAANRKVKATSIRYPKRKARSRTELRNSKHERAALPCTLRAACTPAMPIRRSRRPNTVFAATRPVGRGVWRLFPTTVTDGIAGNLRLDYMSPAATAYAAALAADHSDDSIGGDVGFELPQRRAKLRVGACREHK